MHDAMASWHVCLDLQSSASAGVSDQPEGMSRLSHALNAPTSGARGHRDHTRSSSDIQYVQEQLREALQPQRTLSSLRSTLMIECIECTAPCTLARRPCLAITSEHLYDQRPASPTDGDVRGELPRLSTA